MCAYDTKMQHAHLEFHCVESDLCKLLLNLCIKLKICTVFDGTHAYTHKVISSRVLRGRVPDMYGPLLGLCIAANFEDVIHTCVRIHSKSCRQKF